MIYVERAFSEPEQSYFLFGPRGVGKSTLMKSRHPDALVVDLLKPDIYRNYLSGAERLGDLIEGSRHKKLVIIDEVQKVPALLSVVHSQIEEKKGIKFILTGSNARKLKYASANLLGGRALKRILHPYMASELSQRFSLEKSLKEGLIPLIFDSPEPLEALEAYISLYLHEEIQAEGLIRNLESFSRFLESVSFSHATILNVTNIARDCQVKRKTVENYLGILEDLLLAYQLPIFDKRAKRELIAHSKFYLFDAGVFYCLRPKGILDRTEEINGAALEGLVAQHLRAWVDYSREKYKLYYWRTRAGIEVDFVMYGEKNLWAIEVKNSQSIHSSDIKSLEIFLQDYPSARAMLLYRGKEKIKIRDVLCIPCEEFLLTLRPNQDL